MAKVYDRWHLSRPPAGAEPCAEHSTKTKPVYASGDHGVGKRWQVRYRGPAGEQKKENFDKRTVADARAAEVKSELDKGEYVDRAIRRQTFREYAEDWRTAATHRERTESNVERALRLHVYPLLGDRQIAGIKRSDLRAWVKDRSAVLAPSSLRTPWNALVGVMAAAHFDGIVRTNPCHGIDLPEIRKPEVVPLDPVVVRALLAGARPRYRALMRLAATTGLRQGELFGLEVEHLDLQAGTLEVEQQLVGPDKGVPYLGQPKTEKSYRTVPLSASAIAAVEEHLEAFPPAEVEIEDRTDPRKPVIRKARLLFVSQYNDPIRRGSWAKVWARMVKRANTALADAQLRVPEGTTTHDFRHFYASVLIEHGASIKKVQRRLGHAKPSITLDLYIHLYQDEEDTTAALIDEALGDVP
ncbi:putative prophage phiRv2 integrase [Streptomyces sp. MBT84]|uniref:tyrosine-type recombinase/integrase n=1 Tax=Streptomyces sp. MBT84 TaxID=1488414 RepID=UPI001C6F086C|nr:site-specific integrase [Streptomyces sp. MBT84]MBW8704415.1 putative prophage phiRv2 integrase [Streptomyces sp. MBT84]